MNAEKVRLEEDRLKKFRWKKWGPYLSERQWGTVREDYGDTGNAWDYFTHDQARSRTYRWGEDGLAGISDDRQLLCFAVALWNEKDPYLKERLFGLTNNEGNHGEDVKECYFYLDSTPTHSYMKYLYKYPQLAFPYDKLVSVNRGRSRHEWEYELMDTGVFDENRYFDVFVEYAKAATEDILIRVTVWNRGPDTAKLHVLPTIWFRNIWAWGKEGLRPQLRQTESDAGNVIVTWHHDLGERFLYADGAGELLFTENETNSDRIFGTPNRSFFVKDGINDYIVHRRYDAVNPAKKGTKAAAHFALTIGPGESRVLRLRLRDVAPVPATPTRRQYNNTFGSFDGLMEIRRREADEFYESIIPSPLNADQANVMRQALAGMLWSKQFYYYDVHQWLKERGSDPFKPQRPAPRNEHWHHMYNCDVISMPDKWEYPWYASWDLAFHVIALTLVDEEFGKKQLDLILQAQYQHPNGQLPAYEWNFSAVNPPVHAWATIFTYRLEQARQRPGSLEWLELAFQKLLLTFTWWVNRKDRLGRNVFEGGILGLDNIGVFDRSAPLPTGGNLDQADGTAWMALFCQNMLEIASALAEVRPTYLAMCRKFAEHFLWIASSMAHTGDGVGMWDEEDGFFYDVLRLPDGSAQRLKVRSMVGLLPLCAVTVFEGNTIWSDGQFSESSLRFLKARPELRAYIHDPAKRGWKGRRLASILNEYKLRRVLKTMLDESEFFSPYGIRSLSQYHAKHPYVLRVGSQEFGVGYLPGESDSDMFGGNSNWRGPIWMPVNALIVRALLQYYSYYGNDFTIECPTGSGRHMTLFQVAHELTRRLTAIFLRNSDGRRPVYGGLARFQQDPYWRDLIFFHEYFHGDNGAGLGANHQTGWTGLIARALHLFANTTAQQILDFGKLSTIIAMHPDKYDPRRKVS